MRRTGWRTTPARMLPAILAAVFATVVGWGLPGSANTAAASARLAVDTVSAATDAGRQATDAGRQATDAGRHGTGAGRHGTVGTRAGNAWPGSGAAPLDSARLALARSGGQSSTGTGAALAARTYRPGTHLRSTTAGERTGRHLDGKIFSPVGSRAPPRTA